MYCKHCGKELSDTALFCIECGKPTRDVHGLGNAIQRQKPNKLHTLAIIAVIFIIICVIFYKICSNDSQEKENSSLSSASISIEVPLNITDMRFDTNERYIDMTIKNISVQTIAYVYFDTFFYDRLGSRLDTTFWEESKTLKYTGPLKSGEGTSIRFDGTGYMPFDTSAVFPKSIKVVFLDDSEISFENDLYCASDDFCGKKFKD